MAKTRSRSPKSRASASRAKGAKKGTKKGTKKGAKKSAVKRRKTPTRATLASVQEMREGLDVKKLRLDLQLAIATLQRRIEQGDAAKGLPETRELFLSWVHGIEQTVCADVNGPCGQDMFIGS